MSIKRIFDFAHEALQKYPQDEMFITKYDGKWEKTSTNEFCHLGNQISRGLLKFGIKPGDKIALITTASRTEWAVMDLGISQIGAVSVPVYPSISSDDFEYIFNNAEVQYCFLSDKDLLDKVSKIKQNVPTLKGVFSFDKIEGTANWKEVLDLGKDDDTQSEVDDLSQSINSEDLATIIYTSGTTGKPKGVMLSHHNIVSDVLSSSSRIPFEPGTSVALSFLPVCHIFERMILYLYQYYGVSIYFGESIDKVSDNIKEVKPNVMSAVPRLLEKVYDKIYAKGTELTGIKKSLFFWAIDLGLKYEPYGANGAWYEFQLKIARKLIFSKWKEGLGGNLDLMVSGSAALQPRLARIFAAAEIPVMEGYGLTETSPVISVNDMRNRGFKVGTVGKVIDNVEVKIASDGEILCKGPNVMMGYYKDEKLTNEVIIDGYFHTGDIGEIDSDGFLKITDRKKEMFKTSGGKYIAPQIIENTMKQSRFIDQIMVIGDGQKMPAAFIQPNFDFVKEWSKIHKLNIGNTNTEIISNEKVIERIQEEIDLYNKKFGHWEQIKRFELTPEIWSIEGGELTPTLKLKRKVIIDKYKDLFQKIYS